tara:strand:- start:231 stop:407 length:177 start_codon:yes stop_codon:yes gene_type:complete
MNGASRQQMMGKSRQVVKISKLHGIIEPKWFLKPLFGAKFILKRSMNHPKQLGINRKR